MPDNEISGGHHWIVRPSFRIRTASGRVMGTDERPLIMGILNVTPDSFSDGGEFCRIDRALTHARDMAQQGADIIDIGGESTRPGGMTVDPDIEKQRVLPVIKELAMECRIPLSIDTRKASVAEAALEAGAEIINDVSALRYDTDMASVAASNGAAVCLMHMQGEPQTMQNNPSYGDVVEDIGQWLKRRAEAALGAGISTDRIMVDPGFGFGKLPEHNLEILRRLGEFHGIGLPLLIGVSRKSTIGEVLDKPPDQRLSGTLAAAVSSVLAGVHILRVHDVGATGDATKIAEAIRRGIGWRK